MQSLEQLEVIQSFRGGKDCLETFDIFANQFSLKISMNSFVP